MLPLSELCSLHDLPPMVYRALCDRNNSMPTVESMPRSFAPIWSTFSVVSYQSPKRCRQELALTPGAFAHSTHTVHGRSGYTWQSTQTIRRFHCLGSHESYPPLPTFATCSLLSTRPSTGSPSALVRLPLAQSTKWRLWQRSSPHAATLCICAMYGGVASRAPSSRPTISMVRAGPSPAHRSPLNVS